MRIVTKASGLLLSETVPDNFILVCENTYPGRMNRTVRKMTESKDLPISFGFADVFRETEV